MGKATNLSRRTSESDTRSVRLLGVPVSGRVATPQEIVRESARRQPPQTVSCSAWPPKCSWLVNSAAGSLMRVVRKHYFNLNMLITLETCPSIMSPVNMPLPLPACPAPISNSPGSHNRRVVMEAILPARPAHARGHRARPTALTPGRPSIPADQRAAEVLESRRAGRRARHARPARDAVRDQPGTARIPSGCRSTTEHDGRGRGGPVGPHPAASATASPVVDHPTPEQALPPVRDVVETLRKSSDVDWSRVLGLLAGGAGPVPRMSKGLSAVGPTALPGW